MLGSSVGLSDLTKMQCPVVARAGTSGQVRSKGRCGVGSGCFLEKSRGGLRRVEVRMCLQAITGLYGMLDASLVLHEHRQDVRFTRISAKCLRMMSRLYSVLMQR